MFNPFREVNWRPSLAERRTFGWSLVIGFPSLAAVLLLATRLWSGTWRVPPFLWLGGCGLAAGALFVAIPRLARPFYLLWYFLACCIGTVVGNTLLSAFYLLIVTPIGAATAGVRAAGSLQDLRPQRPELLGGRGEDRRRQGLLQAILRLSNEQAPKSRNRERKSRNRKKTCSNATLGRLWSSRRRSSSSSWMHWPASSLTRPTKIPSGAPVPITITISCPTRMPRRSGVTGNTASSQIPSGSGMGPCGTFRSPQSRSESCSWATRSSRAWVCRMKAAWPASSASR